MCELGSQGGMDGRWHCSAAQVDILLFRHADILLLMLCHFLSLPSCVSFFPPSYRCASVSIIMSACSIDRLDEKMGTKREGPKEGEMEGGWRGGGFSGIRLFYKLLWFIDVI